MAKYEKDQDSDVKGGKEPMVQRNITIPLSLWEESKRKAGIRPLSAVIRELLKMWLDGKVKID